MWRCIFDIVFMLRIHILSCCGVCTELRVHCWDRLFYVCVYCKVVSANPWLMIHFDGLLKMLKSTKITWRMSLQGGPLPVINGITTINPHKRPSKWVTGVITLQ